MTKSSSGSHLFGESVEPQKHFEDSRGTCKCQICVWLVSEACFLVCDFYVKVSNNEKYVPGMCEKDICARSKNAIIRKSLSGEAHKQILQNSARDSHHRMICGSGVILAMQNVLLVNEISASTILCIFMTSEYVTFTMVTATRSICASKAAQVL